MSVSTHRPEHLGPPEIFYDAKEAGKYSRNSHIIKIQSELSERAYELLELDEDSHGILLDIGCGSGLSGQVLSDNGHEWIGVDISENMLRVASEENKTDGDLILHDMGTGLPFRPGMFDGAISISAIQWLCHSNSSKDNPYHRLHRFFQSLYACLARSARAVFQFYPENRDQYKLITDQALKVGFQGGIVVDFPDSPRLRKLYLVIVAGGSSLNSLPSGLTTGEGIGEEDEHVSVTNREKGINSRSSAIQPKRPPKGSRAWIEAKRERHIKKGMDVKHLSKYSGRKRR